MKTQLPHVYPRLFFGTAVTPDISLPYPHANLPILTADICLLAAPCARNAAGCAGKGFI